MTNIDTSAEACELWAQHMTEFHDKDTADLIRQLVRERDSAERAAIAAGDDADGWFKKVAIAEREREEARGRALDDAAGLAVILRDNSAVSTTEMKRRILALKGPKP